MGRMGNAWLRAVMASKEVEFVGFVEKDSQTIEKRAKEYKLNRKIIFKSLPEALKVTNPDGIINVTPPDVHEKIAFLSFNARIPVLSEKPLSDNIESAKRIVEESNRTGILLMVAQDYRYSKQMQTLKNILNDKKLGNPGTVYINFFYKQLPKNILEYSHKLHSLLLNDMSIHHFDAIRLLFKSEPITIWGKEWNPTWSWLERNASAIVVMELKNGIKVSYNASFCSTCKTTNLNGNWRIECERGVIVLEDDVIDIFTIDDKQIKVEMEKLEYERQAYLLHEFHLALTKGIKPATTCQDNIKSIKMVFDTIKSIETGVPYQVQQAL
jgi:predicted dehydrogenase